MFRAKPMSPHSSCKLSEAAPEACEPDALEASAPPRLWPSLGLCPSSKASLPSGGGGLQKVEDHCELQRSGRAGLVEEEQQALLGLNVASFWADFPGFRGNWKILFLNMPCSRIRALRTPDVPEAPEEAADQPAEAPVKI